MRFHPPPFFSIHTPEMIITFMSMYEYWRWNYPPSYFPYSFQLCSLFRLPRSVSSFRKCFTYNEAIFVRSMVRTTRICIVYYALASLLKCPSQLQYYKVATFGGVERSHILAAQSPLDGAKEPVSGRERAGPVSMHLNFHPITQPFCL